MDYVGIISVRVVGISWLLGIGWSDRSSYWYGNMVWSSLTQLPALCPNVSTADHDMKISNMLNKDRQGRSLSNWDTSIQGYCKYMNCCGGMGKVVLVDSVTLIIMVTLLDQSQK